MEGVLPTAAHDIWVVRNGVKEILLPAVEDVIISVSTMNKEIRVRDMDGLTESDDL
jgi:ribosomal 30S subunit maturation factor RimM